MTLFITALSIGFVHTLMGPDHYVPFIVIGRARRWGLTTTSLLTAVCGIGHVLSSVVLGLIGLMIGAALSSIQGWEGMRGEWAGWALLGLGVGYTGWGVWRAKKSSGHSHLPGEHVHADDERAADGGGDPVERAATWKTLTPWLLVIVFVLGPCEPLIPLFFASGLEGGWQNVALACGGYAAATLLTMHAMVTLFWLGLSKVDLGPLERWTHVMAGGVIALAGAGMVFFGL
jgi:hypothetical protein